jgi:CBS domain-containing protein
MRPASAELFITPDRSMMEAIEHMVRTGLERLVVIEDGRCTGLITRSAVAQFLQLHQA